VFKKSSIIAEGFHQPSPFKKKIEKQQENNKNLKPAKPVANKTAMFHNFVLIIIAFIIIAFLAIPSFLPIKRFPTRLLYLPYHLPYLAPLPICFPPFLLCLHASILSKLF